MIGHVRQLTDHNHHCEARAYVAREILQDPELASWYDALQQLRDRQGYLTSDQSRRWYRLDTEVLRPRLTAANLSHYYDAL